MSAPRGLMEDLELERQAAAELERQADELWAAGGLAARTAALALRAEAREARVNVIRLELVIARLE
jgi:hypothetical protein